MPASERRRHRLHRWGDRYEVREFWYEQCFANLDAFLGQFSDLQEITIDRHIVDSAVSLRAMFQLDSDDAVHAATALAVGATTLVTLDADFLRLAGIPGLDIHLIK